MEELFFLKIIKRYCFVGFFQVILMPVVSIYHGYSTLSAEKPSALMVRMQKVSAFMNGKARLGQ
jgi:hypothetical protein